MESTLQCEANGIFFDPLHSCPGPSMQNMFCYSGSYKHLNCGLKPDSRAIGLLRTSMILFLMFQYDPGPDFLACILLRSYLKLCIESQAMIFPMYNILCYIKYTYSSTSHISPSLLYTSKYCECLNTGFSVRLLINVPKPLYLSN